MVQLQKSLAEFEELDIAVFGVSIETPDQVKPTVKKIHNAFPLICDVEGKLVDTFGLRDPGASPEGGDVSRSASILVDSQGKVLWIYQTDNYRVRPHPATVLKAIRDLIGPASPGGP